MRRLVLNDSGLRRTWTRGAAFMWALLIAFPLMFFGLALAVDMSRVIIAGREMSTATHAAALAAAYQFNTGEATINPSKARQAAQETLCVARGHQGLKNTEPPHDSATVGCQYGGRVSVTTRLLDSRTVEVTSRFRVSNLLLLDFFNGQDSDQSVTRTAAVCDPRDTAGPTGGYCARPTQ